jgi:hypothetical protein
MIVVHKVRTIWIGARGGAILYQLISSLRYQLIGILLLAVLPAMALILYSGFEERASAALQARKLHDHKKRDHRIRHLLIDTVQIESYPAIV